MTRSWKIAVFGHWEGKRSFACPFPFAVSFLDRKERLDLLYVTAASLMQGISFTHNPALHPSPNLPLSSLPHKHKDPVP